MASDRRPPDDLQEAVAATLRRLRGEIGPPSQAPGHLPSPLAPPASPSAPMPSASPAPAQPDLLTRAEAEQEIPPNPSTRLAELQQTLSRPDPSERPRPQLLPSMLSILAVGLFAGIGWWAYKSINATPKNGEVPVVAADQTPEKVPPPADQSAAATATSSNKTIYNEVAPGSAPEPKTEVLLPAPEALQLPATPPPPPSTAADNGAAAASGTDTTIAGSTDTSTTTGQTMTGSTTAGSTASTASTGSTSSTATAPSTTGSDTTAATMTAQPAAQGTTTGSTTGMTETLIPATNSGSSGSTAGAAAATAAGTAAALATPPAATTPAKTQAPAGTADTGNSTASAPATTTQTASTTTTGAGTSSAPAASTVAPATTTTAPAPATTQTASIGNYRIQLASVKSEASAKATWKRLVSKHKSVLGSLTVHIEKVSLTSGTYYRVQAGPFTDKASAEAACVKLKAQSQQCLVKP